MEILIAALILVLLGVLASSMGVDTRDLDTRTQPRAW